MEETLQHTHMMHENAASVGIAQTALKHSICVFICDSSVVPIFDLAYVPLLQGTLRRDESYTAEINQILKKKMHLLIYPL